MKSVKSLPKSINRFEYVLGLLIALVVSDGLMTEFIVSSEIGREGNPFLAPIVGGGYVLLIKIAGALLCALILWDIHRRRPKLALLVSLFFVVFYTGIIYWSLAVFLVSQV